MAKSSLRQFQRQKVKAKQILARSLREEKPSTMYGNERQNLLEISWQHKSQQQFFFYVNSTTPPHRIKSIDFFHVNLLACFIPEHSPRH
jgi:hypothetical protein